MRFLIAGGTSFVGRAVALAALDAGHDVTVINRGVTPSDLPVTVARLVGDRTGDMSALAGLDFDVTVDTIAYRPGDVAALRGALGDRGGHLVQISSVSAYEDPPEEGATEATARLWPTAPEDPAVAITEQTYGPLKAACERAAHELFGERVTIVRPTYVIGGHDVTLRFPYWVQRCRRGGTVAVPGPRSVALQYVDARDLGAFVVGLGAGGVTGAFHAAGPFPPARFVDVVEAIARHVGPPGTVIAEVDPTRVAARGLEAGFPLWSGPTSETALALDPAKAIAAGLALRSLEESVDDTAAWWGNREWPERWLAPGDEAALLTGP